MHESDPRTQSRAAAGHQLTVEDFERAAGEASAPESASAAELAPARTDSARSQSRNAGLESSARLQSVHLPPSRPTGSRSQEVRLAVERADAAMAHAAAPIERRLSALTRTQQRAAQPAPVSQPAVPERVDGFGAEAAVLAPSPRTASRHETEVVRSKLPEDPPATSDPALAAISRPSNVELADAALQPRLPNLYTHNGQLIVPEPLRGSHEVLVHQNEMADAAGLERIENDAQLNRLRAHHQLVDFPESASLQLNPELPENRRCARPWSVKFAADMARAYYARFHEPLMVTSAVRTVQYQLRLQRVNGNAAAVDGEGASPHLTGQAIDFGKSGMSTAEIAWMRAYLLPLMQANKIDVEEEFRQACFHISVYRSYLMPARGTERTDVAQLGEGRE
jgi:hypothetical protein